MERIVHPEILDGLEATDPRAVRSRKDLRLINRFMRGELWILNEIEELSKRNDQPLEVVELGAGSGTLLNSLAAQHFPVIITGVDLQPSPDGLHRDVTWKQENVLAYEEIGEETVVIANLFLHHLGDEQLRNLGERLSHAKAVFFSEPHRAKLPEIMGECLFPFVNEVTRHDMIVSIRAGFQKGELPSLLGGDFLWEESFGVFGGLRVKGGRR